jgi:uncharacterized protein (DUF697 family)
VNYQITKPCTQNWDEMTPSNNGRFCLHCQKEVYDLASGINPPNTLREFCGRIKVNPPVKEISFKKLTWKQSPFKFIVLSILMLFTRNIKAQLLNRLDTLGGNNIDQNRDDTITKTIWISGTLFDEKTKEAIPFANIIVMDSIANVLSTGITDLDGKYWCKIDKVLIKGKNISIKASYVGYETTIVKNIPINSFKRNITICADKSPGSSIMAFGAVIQTTPGIIELNTQEQKRAQKDDVFNSEFDNKKAISPKDAINNPQR